MAVSICHVLVWAGALTLAGCALEPEGQDAEEPPLGESVAPLSWGAFPEPGPTNTNTPIGFALQIENGTGVRLKVRRGQRFYINQLDMRVSIETQTDRGVAGLDAAGDFASLDWRGIQQVDQSFSGQANPDGTRIRRRFYRKARWMELPSIFLITQVDARGRSTGEPLLIDTGLEQHAFSIDSFFARRLRAIQYANDCASETDCSNATSFTEEALVELRYANGPNPNVVMDPRTTALRVLWSARPNKIYSIPVEQVANPQWDYGFAMDLRALTPPASNGTYAPGQIVQFQLTMKDGAGKPLHAPGTLPSYNDFLTGNTPSGIQYWNTSEPFATYYRRKHREKQMYVAVEGPLQDLQPIRSVIDPLTALDFETGALTIGKPATDGMFAAAVPMPSLFQLFDPSLWDTPGSDTVSFRIPTDAKPGTYYALAKARRVFLGEEIPLGKVIKFQVGTTQQTTAKLGTGGCQNCHNGGASLERVMHGITDRASCTGCHAPLANELEGPVYVRTHFIHSRSNRFDKPLQECKNCHLDRQSIQRVSKSACFSCHTEYNGQHVAQFGAVSDMYVGGGAESFAQCTTTCHTNHPGSGL